METSFFQQLKLHLIELIHLSKDAIHIYVGMSVYVLWNGLLKKNFASLKALLPVVGVAVLLELFDMWDNYHSTGSLRITASLHDIANTCFWPLVLVLLLKSAWIKRDLRDRK